MRLQQIMQKYQKYQHILLVISVLFIFFFTFIARETMNIRHSENRGLSLIPFREYVAMFKNDNHSFFFRQIFLNILLFVPFGYTFTAVLTETRKVRKKHFMLNGCLTVLIAGFIFSFGIELLQYVTSLGYSEIDDVINNTIGAAVGYLLYKQTMWFCGKRKEKITK